MTQVRMHWSDLKPLSYTRSVELCLSFMNVIHILKTLKNVDTCATFWINCM